MRSAVVTTMLAVAVLVAPVARAQIVRDMTPAQVQQAIDFGTKAKNLSAYGIQEKAKFSWPPVIAAYTTPFLRVALAAHEAKKKYKAFSPADVTPDMLTPDIQVYASSKSLEGTAIANVETVVILPHKSEDRSQAIHPTRTTEATTEYKNLFGFTGEGRGIVAVFPIDVWTEANEIHVVFDTGIPSGHGSGARGGCTDCKSRIYLDKIR
jgi:hypothetical protein